MTARLTKWKQRHQNISYSGSKAASLKVPSHPAMLMWGIDREVLPRVRKYLEYCQQQAEQIPDSELRKRVHLIFANIFVGAKHSGSRYLVLTNKLSAG
ncbi:hypothetical protein QT972_28020, partial [Microcoleus sp. herbarium7]